MKPRRRYDDDEAFGYEAGREITAEYMKSIGAAFDDFEPEEEEE